MSTTEKIDRNVEIALTAVRQAPHSDSKVGVASALPAKKWIPAGVAKIDSALHGGIPLGAITEIFGMPGTGKTSLALRLCASAQAHGLLAAYVDAEYSLSASWASRMGVVLDKLIVVQPDSGEAALDSVEALVRCGEVGFIVIDSVPALLVRDELPAEHGLDLSNRQKTLLDQAMRKLCGLTAQHNVALVFINQKREKPSVMFGDPYETVGGEALRYYASMRIEVFRRETLARNRNTAGLHGEPYGILCEAVVCKSKVCQPFGRGKFHILFEEGLKEAVEP